MYIKIRVQWTYAERIKIIAILYNVNKYRTTTEHTLTKNTVVIPPIAFNELCTKERGNDWLPTIGQLRVLVASSPVAPQHKWMLRNSSFENIMNRQMSSDATSEHFFFFYYFFFYFFF